MTDHQAQIHRDIARVGWHVVKVRERTEADEPPFAYTLGLTRTYGHPELMIVGLDLDDMHAVLNDLGDLVKAGRVFASMDEVAEILEGCLCRIAPVAHSQLDMWVGQALEYYGNADVTLLQCLWPDRNGRFPGDADFDERLSLLQPLLS